MSCRQCTVTVLNPDNHVFCQTLDSCVKNVDPPFIMFTLPLGWASFRLHHVQLPARSSSTVSDRLLSTGLRRGVTAAPPFSQSTTSSGRTASPSQHVRPQGFCRRWHDDLELFSQIISGIRTLLWITSSACWKRFCSHRISAISALDVSRRCALQIYILLTYLLTHCLAVF